MIDFAVLSNRPDFYKSVLLERSVVDINSSFFTKLIVAVYICYITDMTELNFQFV